MILECMAAGKSLLDLCEKPGMPDRATVSRWLLADIDGFRAKYAQARDVGLDVMADEVLRIADSKPDKLESGGVDAAAVGSNRLRFDARRWYLSKLAPKRYGDRITTEITGPDGGPVLIDDAARAARLAALVDAVKARKPDPDEPA